MLLCAELAGFDTGVNTKALEYTDNKSDTGTHTHAKNARASMHTLARTHAHARSLTKRELGFSGKRTHVTTAHVGQ